MKEKVKGAFTLIEMMVVVAIIGVLGSMLLPNVNRMLSKAKISGTQGIVNNTFTALLAYADDNGDYPSGNYYNRSYYLRSRLRDYASFNDYGTFLRDTWNRWMSYHYPSCYGYVGAFYSNGPDGGNDTWSCWWWRYRGFNDDDIGKTIKK